MDIVEDSLSYDYTYDALNRVDTVTDANGMMDYTYNALGLVTELDRPNGITTVYGYDALTRLEEIDHQNTGGSLTRFEYDLNNVGNRTRVDEFINNTLTGYITWDYDNLYRLTEEARYNASDTLITETDFTYDDVGNRETQTVDTLTTTYTYNALDQLDYSVTSSVTTDYTYDDRGNLIEIDDGVDTTQYAWDAEDQLAGAILPDSTVIAYGYDADGRRVQQDEDGTITNYVWDETSMYGDVVMEYDDTGDPLVDYTLADGQSLAQDRGAVSYYLADAQGSVRALADDMGDITDTYDYTAFGELYASTGSTVNSYLYTGQQFDDLTGLYSLRARYYDPFVGRFLSQDTYPIDYSHPIELNRYGYTANDPINGFDPSGNSNALAGYGILTVDRGAEENEYAPPYAAGTAAMVCTVLWALGTYAGEANVCGFQASVTNDGISFYPFYAPPNTGTPVIDPDTVKPPDVIPDLIDGGDSPSGGDDGGGGTIISKLVKATAIVITTTAVNEAIDLVLQPEPAPQPDEEPLPDPPDQDECVLEDAPGTTLGGNDCDDPLLVEIWRGVGGNKKKDYWKNPSLKPRDFRPRPGVDDDGLSLFELANLPPNPVTPYAYPFTVLILGEKISGVTGLLSEVPACTATFTPEHGPGHWSVNCSGSIDQLLSGYAEDNRDRTILYPSFIGDFAEDRQFDWPN